MTLDYDNIIDGMATAMLEVCPLVKTGLENGRWTAKPLEIGLFYSYAKAAFAAMQDNLPEFPDNASLSGAQEYIKTLNGYLELYNELRTLGK